MVKENCRELNYDAAEAGVKQTITWNSESLIITTAGFNTECQNFFYEISQKMHMIFDNPKFFESKRKQLLVTIDNLIGAEPMNRYRYLLSDILMQDNLSIEQQKEMIEKFTYESFVDYSEIWLQNTSRTWFITGHLTEKKALEVVQNSKQAEEVTI